jgi:hypothetical protein
MGNYAPAMNRISPSIENRLAEHHHHLPVWIRAPKTGEEYFTGFKRGKLYLLASKGLIRSFTLREPGNVQGCRFFHLQSILDYLERCEKREKGESVGTDAEKTSTAPTLKGETVYAANALTGGGNEYLIGIFAGESDAWLAAQRELDQGRKVWIEPQVIG